MLELVGARETRPVAVEHVEESDELELDYPSAVILHLKLPNVSIPMNAESIKDPDQVAHRMLQTYKTRYKLNGLCFDRGLMKGRRRDRWCRWLDEAALGSHGKFYKSDGSEITTEQALSELRK